MNAQTETIDYRQLKQAKSLAEFLGYIPDRYFEKVLLFLLGFFNLSPVLMVALLNCGVTFFNPYYLLLQMGYVGMVVSGLLFYKRKKGKVSLEKTTIKQWLGQHGSYLCLAAVLLLGILATVFSTDSRLAFFGDYYRKEGLLTIGAYAGIFMAASGIRNQQLKKRLVEIFVLTSLFLGIIVILQWRGLPIQSVVYQFGINDSVDFVLWAAIFHNINHYGYYLTMAIMATAGLFVYEEQQVKKLFWCLVFGLLTWVLIKNNTFGAYLGVCAGLLLLVVIGINRKEGFRKMLILMAVFIGISFMANGIVGQVKNNFVALSEDMKSIVKVTAETAEEKDAAETIAVEKEINKLAATRSGFERWVLWMDAVEIMKEHPILGVGPDNLAMFYEEKGIRGDRPHNELLQIGASLGVPAMIFYLSALGLGFFQIFRNLKKMSQTEIIAVGAVGGYLVSAMFGNTMYYTYPYFLIFLAIALTGAQKPVGGGVPCNRSKSISISQ